MYLRLFKKFVTILRNNVTLYIYYTVLIPEKHYAKKCYNNNYDYYCYIGQCLFVVIVFVLIILPTTRCFFFKNRSSNFLPNCNYIITLLRMHGNNYFDVINTCDVIVYNTIQINYFHL